MNIIRMEEKVELTFLYDFYGELLGERSRRIVSIYLLEDLTMAEIAEQEGISRQAVHDQVKRAAKKLRDYEDKLRLFEKFQAVKEKVRQARGLTGNEKVQTILNEILDVM